MKRLTVALVLTLQFPAWIASSEELSIGRFALLDEAAKPLVRTESLNSQLGEVADPSFVRRVGGIAFDAIAHPAADLNTRPFDIQYSKDNPDGHRLVIEFGGTRVLGSIHDWQLVPIAKFADSNLSGVFTLFGSLADETREQEILDRGGRILNYAPPFENTLVGLRLFQLDVLLLDDELAIELPRKGETYILGSGESEPNIDQARAARKRYYKALAIQFEGLDDPWQSYVICDCFQKIEFTAQQNKLVLSGNPYYYFWTSGYDQVLEHEALGLARSKGLIADSGSSRDLEMVLNELPAAEEAIFLQELRKRMEQAAADESAIYLKQYSEQRNLLNGLIEEFNPAVWRTGVKVMRYAAFFRYVKQTHPEKWREFLEALDRIRVHPEIQTPEIMMYR